MDQSITLSYGSRITSTIVSNIFIDNYMTDARGSDVKVYLYLLRCLQDPSTPVSIESIAEALDETEKDIRTSLKYWDKQHVISLSCGRGGKIKNITVHDLDEEAEGDPNGYDMSDSESNITLTSDTKSRLSRSVPAPATINGKPYGRRADDIDVLAESETDSVVRNQEPVRKPEQSQSKKNVKPLSDSKENEDEVKDLDEPKIRPNYSMDMIRSFMDEYPDFDDLVDYVEKVFGKTLTTRNLQTVSFIFEELGLPTELIRFLYDYCVTDKGKRSDSYIEKIARDWHSKGIRTIDDALKDISEFSNRFAGLKTSFGLNRALLDAELPYVKRWYFEYAFSDDMIKEACNRTVLATSKTDFRYANKILKSWHEQGFKTLEDVKNSESSFTSNIKPLNSRTIKSKSQDFQQRTYTDEDYLAFERKKLGIQ